MEKLQGGTTTKASKPSTEHNQYGPAHKIAALFNQFTRKEIISLQDKAPKSLVQHMSKSQLKQGLSHLFAKSTSRYSLQHKDLLWALDKNERKQILKELWNSDQLPDLLKFVGAGKDQTEVQLRNILSGESLKMPKPKVADLQSLLEDADHLDGSLNNFLRELRRILKITDWVEGHPKQELSRREIQWQINFLELIAPFRTLTRHFAGRTKEMTELRTYVNYLPSESVLESITRGITEFSYSLSLKKIPPLVIHGLGGVGKSTLVAKFILNHIGSIKLNQMFGRQKLIFVYIDFDQGRVSLREPLSVLDEVTSQLILQFQHQQNDWELLNKKIKEKIENIVKLRLEKGGKLSKKKVSTSSLHEQMEVAKEFKEIWIKTLNNIEMPLLIVLDSFEEVQRLGDTVLFNFFEFFDRWLQQAPNIRLVIAGRAPIPTHIIHTQSIALKEFDQAAARGYLKSKGLKDNSLINFIINNCGRHPLTLKLALEVLNQESFDKKVLRDINGQSFFKIKIDNRRIQGELFQRNLNHIQNPRVRKIAFPGMVLRSISPDLIKHVLAQSCELGPVEEKEAEELFEEFSKEKFLVESSMQNVLRFRKDLRQLILPLVIKEGPEKSRIIRRKALEYFEGKSDLFSKAEYIYYHLSLEKDPKQIKHLLESGLLSHLRYSIDELPVKAQIFLANYFDLPISKELRKAANIEVWESHMAAEIQEAMSQSSLKALQHLKTKLEERGERSEYSTLYLWEAGLHYRLHSKKQFEDALFNAKEVLRVKKNDELKVQLLAWEADYREYHKEYEKALEKVLEVLEVKINLAWKSDTLGLLRQMVRLMHRRDSNSPNEIDDLNQMINKLLDAFPKVTLTPSDFYTLIVQVIHPFYFKFLNEKKHTSLFIKLQTNWVNPSLKKTKAKKKEINTPVKVDFNTAIKKWKEIEERSKTTAESYYLSQPAFLSSYNQYCTNIREEFDLEKLSNQIFERPLRVLLIPGDFELRRFEFFLLAEYYDCLIDLSKD